MRLISSPPYGGYGVERVKVRLMYNKSTLKTLEGQLNTVKYGKVGTLIRHIILYIHEDRAEQSHENL